MDGTAMYTFAQQGRFCDIIVSIGGNEFTAHKGHLAAASKYFDTELSSIWTEQRRTRGQQEVLPTSDQPEQPSLEVIVLDLPFIENEEEKCAAFRKALKYIYTNTLDFDVEEPTAAQWFNCIQVADFLVMDKMFITLQDYFKKRFTNPADPSPTILLFYQEVAKYDFLHSLKEHTCCFIKAHLNRIIHCIKTHARDEIGCLADRESDGESDGGLDNDSLSMLNALRGNNLSDGGSGGGEGGEPWQADYDQWPADIPPELLEGAVDEDGNLLVQITDAQGRIRYITRAQRDAMDRRAELREILREQALNQPEPLEEVLNLEKKDVLDPEEYNESELFQICSSLQYCTLCELLDPQDDFSPRVGDLDVFFLIMAWAGCHSEAAPKRPARRSLRSDTQKPESETIPANILRCALSLLQRFMVKNMNNGQKTIDRLLREKSERGKLDEDIFRSYIEHSPTKTPAKRHCLKFFSDELKRYHPISKVWDNKGRASYHEFEECCERLLQAWLKVDESRLHTFLGDRKAAAGDAKVARRIDFDDDVASDHVVPVPSGFARKRKAGDSIDDPDLSYALEDERVPRVPYQAPLVVGSWCGKDENDINYGPSKNMHVWDDSLNRWTKNPNDLMLPTSLCYNGRAFLEPFLYIFGGYDGQRSNSTGMDHAYKINIETLECIEIAPLRVKRLYVTGCSLGTDSVIALGGSSNKKSTKIKRYMEDTGDERFINDSGRMFVVEEYIIAENRWRRLPNMLHARSDASATSYKDVVYVAGGFDGKACLDSVEMYVRDTHQWTELPAMNQKRSGLSLVLYQGNLLALCGFGGKRDPEDGGGGKRGRHKTVECLPLDRATQQYHHKQKANWRILDAQLNEGRSNFGACVLNDNQIVVCGGFNTGTLRSCERWHGSLEEVKSLAYQSLETATTTRRYKQDGWHMIEPLPIEMSAMSVVTISSTSKPLVPLLRSREQAALETALENDLDMMIATPRK